METARARILLTNPVRPDLAAIEVVPCVDARATHLTVPAAVAVQLGLRACGLRLITARDGSTRSATYAGPVLASFQNRICCTGAVVDGTEVLLGSIPMDDLDLVLEPSTLHVTPNPLHPDIPGSIAISPRTVSPSRAAAISPT